MFADRVLVVNNRNFLARFGATRVTVANRRLSSAFARRVMVVNNRNFLARVGAERVYIATTRLAKAGAEPVIVVNPEVLEELGISY